jgi:hypothetical protein
MSESEYKKLKLKIINELRLNNSSNLRINIMPKGNFISSLELMEMEKVTKNKKLDTPNHSKTLTDIIEMNKKIEDEKNRQFNKGISLLLYIHIYTLMNEDDYEKLDKFHRQSETDIKSNNYNLRWFLTELEKHKNIKASNLPEAFMLLKKGVREKNKQLMIGILKDQPEFLEQFKIATMHR